MNISMHPATVPACLRQLVTPPGLPDLTAARLLPQGDGP